MLTQLYHDLRDRYRLSKLDELDWITRNQLILKNTLKDLRHQPPQTDNKLKVLFWGVMPWERGGLEHMLATAMRARGHEVFGMKCAGEMSACSMESVVYPRPDCQSCRERHERLLSVWDLNDEYQPTSEFLTDEDKAEIESLVDDSAIEDLRNLAVKDIPVGQLAYDDLPQFFFRIVDLKEKEVAEYYRRAVKGVAMFTVAANAYLDKVQPDRAVVTSGRTVAFTGFYQLCLKKGIPVVTWDESIGGLGSFIMMRNGIAVNYEKPEAWAKCASEPLEKFEEDFVDEFFGRTAKGDFVRHQYYHQLVSDPDEIKTKLGLDPEKSLTVLLTNLTWDTSALNKDVAFASMIDWLKESIEFYATQPQHQLVIRTHPAEGHAATYARGCESVSEILFETYPQLPSNIKIISGKEELSSHALADMATAIGVYTTTVGLEMAMRGRKVLVMGQCHYGKKGFTVDVETKDEYFRMLMSEEHHQNRTISESQSRLAKKYGYYFIVRNEVYLSEFNIRDRHQYVIKSPSDFFPNQSKRWDALCEHLENDGDFVNCTDFLAPADI